MKRRNVEGSVGKLRRAAKRSKISDGCSPLRVFVNFKFLFVWILVIILDFISEFRFELLYPFWVFITHISETFRYQGIFHFISYVFVTMGIDLFCYYMIPIHWLFFASSTYVWLHFSWYSEKSLTLFSILISISLILLEMFVRLREFKNLPFQFEICKPFAAHGIGYPLLTFGAGCKSYVSYKLRLHQKRIVAKENEFYYSLLNKAVYPEHMTPVTNLDVNNLNITTDCFGVETIANDVVNAENNPPILVNQIDSQQKQTAILVSSSTTLPPSLDGKMATMNKALLNNNCNGLDKNTVETNQNSQSAFSSFSSSSLSTPAKIDKDLNIAISSTSQHNLKITNGTNKVVPSVPSEVNGNVTHDTISDRGKNDGSAANENDAEKRSSASKTMLQKLKSLTKTVATKTKISSLAQFIIVWLQFFITIASRTIAFFVPKVLTSFLSKMIGLTSQNSDQQITVDDDDDGGGKKTISLENCHEEAELSKNARSDRWVESDSKNIKSSSLRKRSDSHSRNGQVKKFDQANDVLTGKNFMQKNDVKSDCLNEKYLENAEMKLSQCTENANDESKISPVSVTNKVNVCDDNVPMNGVDIAARQSQPDSINAFSSENNVNPKSYAPTTNSGKNGAGSNRKNKNQHNRIDKDSNAHLLEVLKAKENQIWKIEMDNQRLKSDLQTIRQCESDLRKQMNVFKNDEKVLNNSILNYKSDIGNLQKKIQNYVNSKQQDKQTIQKLEKQLDDERKRSKTSIEMQAVSEKKARIAEENVARVTAIVNASRNVCTEHCRNRQRDYELLIANLRRDLQAKEEQLRLKEMLMGEYKDFKNKKNVLLGAIKTMYDNNNQLEETLKVEKNRKVELEAALEEAKRQLSKQRIMYSDYEKESREIKKHYVSNPYFSTPTNCLNGFSSSSSPSTASDMELVNRCFSSCSPNTAAVSPSSLSSNTSPLTVAPLINVGDHRFNARSLCNVSPGTNRHQLSALNNNNVIKNPFNSGGVRGGTNGFTFSSINDFSSLNDTCIDGWDAALKSSAPSLSAAAASSTLSFSSKSDFSSLLGIASSLSAPHQAQQSNCSMMIQSQETEHNNRSNPNQTNIIDTNDFIPNDLLTNNQCFSTNNLSFDYQFENGNQF